MMLVTFLDRSQSLTTSHERAWSLRSTQCRYASYARAAEAAVVREGGVAIAVLPMHTVSTAPTVAIIPHHRGPHSRHLAATLPALVPFGCTEPTASTSRSVDEGGCRCHGLGRSVWVSCNDIRREGSNRVMHASCLACGRGDELTCCVP